MANNKFILLFGNAKNEISGIYNNLFSMLDILAKYDPSCTKDMKGLMESNLKFIGSGTTWHHPSKDIRIIMLESRN